MKVVTTIASVSRSCVSVSCPSSCSSVAGVRGEQPSCSGHEIILVGEMKRVQRDGARCRQLDAQVPVALANPTFVRKERARVVERQAPRFGAVLGRHLPPHLLEEHGALDGWSTSFRHLQHGREATPRTQPRSLHDFDPELEKVVEQSRRVAEPERSDDEVHVGRLEQQSFIELAQPRSELVDVRAQTLASSATVSSRRAAFTRSFHDRVQCRHQRLQMGSVPQPASTKRALFSR